MKREKDGESESERRGKGEPRKGSTINKGDL